VLSRISLGSELGRNKEARYRRPIFIMAMSLLKIRTEARRRALSKIEHF